MSFHDEGWTDPLVAEVDGLYEPNAAAAAARWTDTIGEPTGTDD